MAEQTTVQTKVENLQEAIAMANEIERYEAAIKQMKDMLKAFVEKTGLPVDTGEKIWDFSTSTSWSFSAEQLKEVAAEILMMGHNPWEYLGLGSREIEKLNLPETLLKQYGTAKATKRFSSRKSDAS